MCIFSDKCLENSILPFFCHNFDRFTSNIWSSYLTQFVFIFVLHMRDHITKFRNIFYNFFYGFIPNDFFPECKCIKKKRNELLSLN